MKFPQIPNDEQERLEDLYSYSLPDLIKQPEFDFLVNLASSICDTPIALITIVETEKQWFKAKVGLLASCTSKDVSFCAHAINTPDENFIVEDATKDERFMDNPLVIGDPGVVFYAGVPLVTNSGHALGTICVIDRKPRKLEASQYALLEGLSKQVVRLFELRRTLKLFEEKDAEKERLYRNIDKYANSIGHDVKMAFRNIEISTEILTKLNEGIEREEHLTKIQNESTKAIQLINEVIRITSSENSFRNEENLVEIKKMLNIS